MLRKTVMNRSPKRREGYQQGPRQFQANFAGRGGASPLLTENQVRLRGIAGAAATAQQNEYVQRSIFPYYGNVNSIGANLTKKTY